MATPNTFSAAEVAKHNKDSDLWIVINNQVYDVTKYAPTHPGGVEVLMSVAGTDATESFNDIGHSEDAQKQLSVLLVGVVEGVEVSSVATHQAEKPSTSSKTAVTTSTAPAAGSMPSAPSNKRRRQIALTFIVALVVVLMLLPLDSLLIEVQRLEELIQAEKSTMMSRPEDFRSGSI